MTLHRQRTILLLALLPLTAACDDPAEPETRVDIGVVFIGGVEPEVSVQSAGDDLHIDITTWGTPCTSRHHDEVEVDPVARTITVTPYDEVQLVTCFQSLEPIAHEMSVTPGAAGDWLVRAIGRRIIDNDGVPEVLEIPAHVGIVIDNPNAP